MQKLWHTSPLESRHLNAVDLKNPRPALIGSGVPEAILDLKQAFRAGLLPYPLDDIRYYNIKTMQATNMK